MSELLICRHEHLWVLNKPSGVLTHPGAKDQREPDLLSLAREQLDAPASLAPINRLDLETSGLLLCSADADTRATFGTLLASDQIHKTYLALVFGHTHRKGIVRTPLSDGRRGRPLDALTRWRRLETFGSCSLLQVRPETGRKHQIRKHLQELGHAIVGDVRYPPKRRLKLPAYPHRLWLHAWRLEIPSLELTFEAPLPDPLERQLEALRAMRRDTSPPSDDDATAPPRDPDEP